MFRLNRRLGGDDRGWRGGRNDPRRTFGMRHALRMMTRLHMGGPSNSRRDSGRRYRGFVQTGHMRPIGPFLANARAAKSRSLHFSGGNLPAPTCGAGGNRRQRGLPSEQFRLHIGA